MAGTRCADAPIYSIDVRKKIVFIGGMHNAGLIVVIVIAAALAYVRFEQPETWNQYLQMLKAKAPAASPSPDALPADAPTNTK